MNKGLKKPDLKRSYRKRSNRPDLGFTMVELIVVITIVAIAAALTTLSVLKWQDWSNFNKQNEYAQALYSAAANQLTEYAGNGYLTEFANSLVKKDVKPNAHGTDYYDAEDYLVPVRQVSKLTDAEGNAYAGDAAVWKSLDKSGEGEFGTYIVILKAKAGDIGSVKSLKDAGTDSDKIQAYWIDRLLGSYVADREVLDSATISIEVAPEDGQVFALLYSDRTGDFRYDADIDESTDHYNAANRKETYRSSFMVGYYGVDTLSKAIKGQASADLLKLRMVRLINDESLHLAFNHANDVINPFDTNYEIKIFDAEKKYKNASGKEESVPELTLKLNFPALGTYMGITGDDGMRDLRNSIAAATGPSDAVAIKFPVIRHSVLQNGDTVLSGTKDGEDRYSAIDEEELGTLPFLVWMDGKTVHLVLDAADVQATSWLFENGYSHIYNMTYDSAENAFKDTYSFFRFGQSADNIKCTVKASAFTYADTVPVKSNTENPVFYEEKYSVLGFDTGFIKKTHKKDENSYNYKIRNARHLYNIRYVEDPDIIITQDVEAYLADSVAGENKRQLTFALDRDISWQEFTEAGNLVESNPSLKITVADRTASEFPSFKTLRTRDTIDGTKKKNAMSDLVEETYSLKNFTISQEANDTFAVNTTQTKEGDSYKAVTDPATGFVLVNQGSMTNLTMDEVTVTGEKYVGAFTGINITADPSTVKNLTLENTDDKTQVTGVKNVGGIMGMELPLTDNETVIEGLFNKGKVNGEMAVGGIVGMSRNSFDGEKPEALGQYIADSAWNTGRKKITINDCTNEGMVGGVIPDSITDDEEKREYSRYIGGIAGYLYDDRDADEEVDIKVTNCASAPQYLTAGRLEDKLYGVYVGGIIGYNRFSSISNCTSEIQGRPKGYVFGYKYVGGIVGMNIGPADGTSIEGGVVPVNTNNVVGEYYVGGITGVNASAEDLLSDEITSSGKKDPEVIETLTDSNGKKLLLVPNTKPDMGVSVREWTNKGVVIATKEYAGGITGFNAGWIYNCNSDIDPDVANAVFDKVADGKYCGDYVGGISGYNNGVIGTTDRYASQKEIDDACVGSSKDVGNKKGANGPTLRAAVYVTGCNYVGGIVGYNAVDAIVENYEVAGGHVLAHPDKGYFVGGYAGLNVSMAMLMDMEEQKPMTVADGEGNERDITTYVPRAVYSNPNEITGAYFVGGNVGGNLVNVKSDIFKDIITDSKDTRIYGLFETNNFLGQIKGTHAFTGGFVGYNALFNTDPDAFNEIPESILRTMEEIDERYPDAYTDDDKRRRMLTEKVALMDDLKNNLKDEDGHAVISDSDIAESVMYITGDSDEVIISSNLGRITSDVCVGGVMGYNDSDTKLYIKNAKNATPVVARYAIENPEEQFTMEGKYRKTDFAGEDYKYTYAYAGGILGKVEKNTTIDNCSNAPSGSVTSEGTYRGGMTEVNEGKIINCDVSNFGSAAYQYVGGLAGLNDFVPAVKADEEDHYGIIKNCRLVKKTITGKNMVGGLVAENRGYIYAVTMEKPEIVSGYINRKGFGEGEDKYGVAGVYAAVNCEMGRIYTAEEIKDVNVRSEGSCAGGIVGVNMGLIAPDADAISANGGQKIDRDHPVIITGSVKGYKNAGGVMGVNRSVIKDEHGDPAAISFYKNEADITATNGNAGGIVGDNAATAVIRYCMNDGVVTASNEGNAGGITAQNKSTIEYCVNIGEVISNEGYAGGIAAVNDADEDDDDSSTKEQIGLIKECGVYSPDFFEEEAEKGSGEEYKIGEMFYEDEDYQNRVSLDTPDVNNYEKLAFEAKKYAGGVVAVNYAKIDSCEVRYVEVSNTKNSNKDSAVGIFAGINKKEDGKEGEITLAAGQSTEGTETFSKVNRAAVGGVAGINEGIIEGSALVKVDDTDASIPSSIIYIREYLDETSLANMGGVTGVNRGDIRYVSVKGEIIGDLGDVDIGYGGVTGVNGYTDKSKVGKTGRVPTVDGCTFDGTLKAEGAGSAIARIGGIAGINGYNAALSHSLVGVIDDSINLDREGNGLSMTKIYGGRIEYEDGTLTPDGCDPCNKGVPELEIQLIKNPYDTASYSYVGGVSGENHGQVTECDNYPVSKDRVEISAFTSITGGIVGYNFDDGVVSGTKDIHTTTGDSWVVETRGSDNLSGNGGIIGVSTSPTDLVYLDNHADITSRMNGHSPVGGLVGYIGQKTNMSYLVSDCRNYGDVTCTYRAAGMCSDVTYNNISYKNCINYGRIRSITGKAAGFTQYIAAPSSESYFEGCYNHGDIVAPAGGSGFLSEFAAGTNGNFGAYLTDCVNTGNFYQVAGTGNNNGYSATSEKMFAFDGAGSGIFCDNCRDYSTTNCFSYSANTKKLINSLGHRFYPVITKNSMLDYRGALLPVAKKIDAKLTYNNFYVGNNDHEEVASGVYFTFTPLSSVNNTQYGSMVTDFLEPVTDSVLNVFATQNGDSGKPFIFDIDVDYAAVHDEMSSFVIYLFNNNYDNASTIKRYEVSADVKASEGSFKATAPVCNASNTLESGRVELDVSGYGTVEHITLYVTPKSENRVYFRGFEWVDADEGVHSCDSYDELLCEKYGVGFDIAGNGAMVWSVRSKPDQSTTGMTDQRVDNTGSMFLLRDVDKIPLADRDAFYMNTAKYAYWAQYSLDATYFREDADKMKSIVVYATRQNDIEASNLNRDGYFFSYYAVFTDEDGNSAYTEGETDRVNSRHPIQVDVPEMSDGDENGENKKEMGRITGVTLYLQSHANNINSRQDRVYVNGFGWIPEGKDEAVKLPYYPSVSFESTGNKRITKLVKSDETQRKGDNITLIPEWAPVGYDKAITITKSDPMSDTYAEDESVYYGVYDDPTVSPGWYDSERISFFKEFDPQFESTLFSSEEKDYKQLPAPSWFKKENKNGRYKFMWNKIDGAAAYEVKVSLLSKVNGVEEVRGSTDVMRVSSALCTTDGNDEVVVSYFMIDDIMNIVPEWDESWGARSLRLEVKAISPYHILNENMSGATKFDSDWGAATWTASDVLPTPVYHFEYTGNNRMVAVLENPEDYVGYESYLKYVRIYFNNDFVYDYSDPTDNTVKNKVRNVYIMVSDGRSTSAPFILQGGVYTGNYFTEGTAMSKDQTNMADSADYQKSGTFLFTAEHMQEKYIYSGRFSGFKGTTGNNLEYNIEAMVLDTDFYINGELEAFDEDLGVPVVYSHGVLHTANRHLQQYTYFNIGLGDLPDDIIERDFEVRSYIYASQDDMLQMGHYVERGVELNSLSDVQQLVDESYIDGTTGEITARSIYDSGSLRPGYVLWKNADGTYDIYYNSSLECKGIQPDRSEGTISYDANYQIRSIDYEYSDYGDARDDLRDLSGGYDLYSIKDVSYREEKTQNNTNYTYRYNLNSNLSPKILPMTYLITVTNKNGEKFTVKYREGSYYVTDENDNIYGRVKKYNNQMVYLDDEIDMKNNLDFSSDGSIVGNQKGRVRYYNDPTVRGSCDFIFQTQNVIKDASGTFKNIEFKSFRGYLEFSYTGSASEDPFDFDVKVFYNDIQRVQQAPTISENYVKTTENGHDSFTFYWDQDASPDDPLYEGAEYNVQLFGDTVSQDNVPMAEVNGVKAREYTFTDSQGNWNYKNLRLHVTRVGTLNRYDRTYILPHTAVREEFKVTLKLDTVSIIDASLNTDDTGGFVSDDLDYKVIWDQITDPYQLDDLAGYLIKVVDLKDADGNPVTEPNTHYYPIAVNEKPVFTPEAGSTTLDPMVSGVNPESESQYYAIINLSEFDGGHTLGFTVQPIAKKTAEVYNDGNESNVFEKLLFTRLNTPVIQSDDNALGDYISVDPSTMTSYEDSSYHETLTGVIATEDVDYDHTVTYETYNKGVTFKVTNADNYDAEGADTVTLNMAAAIFDDPADGVTATGAGSDKERYEGGDASDVNPDGYWNSGARNTIFTKETPAVMDGKANAASYNLNLTDYEAYPGEYAGKWIKLAFMASKTNKISSAWTDEDLPERDTVDYYWFRIPKVVLDDVVLGDSLTLKSVYPVEPHVRYYNGSELSDEKKSDFTGTFEQVAIGFEADYNAKGYAFDVKLTSTADSEDPTKKITPMYGLYLCKNEKAGGYDVYIESIKNATVKSRDKKVDDKYDGYESESDDTHTIPGCSITKGDDATYVGHFDGETTGEQRIAIEDIEHTWITDLKFHSYMTYEAGEKSAKVRLVLPDLQKTDSSVNAIDYIATDSVLVQTVTDKDYHSLRRVLWYRNTEGEGDAKHYILGTKSDYMTRAEAASWFSQDSVMTDTEAEDNILGHQEEKTVSENEISAEMEDVEDEIAEEASGIEETVEVEDHEDLAGDMEKDSEKPSETTDVQKDEDTSSSDKSDTSSSSATPDSPAAGGESKSGESNGGDSKSGESKGGETKSYDSRSTVSKAGELESSGSDQKESSKEDDKKGTSKKEKTATIMKKKEMSPVE
ncbi:MAG: prepilin-type N-terminal cleavage/methylation domain-containing protein [Lachnospiraceae bacterium]|nr:prepilin-type N-terminal cleavage/methylation domain-containing protein [Lachnospiraceae bacterium]